MGVRGALPDVDPTLGTLFAEVIGPWSERYVDDEHRLLITTGMLDIDEQQRLDRVRDRARQAFLILQRVLQAGDGLVVRDTDDDRAVGGVGDRRDGLDDLRERGQITLEVQRVALRLRDELSEVHEHGSSTRAAFISAIRLFPRSRSFAQANRSIWVSIVAVMG